jgi:hypothetical protein
VYNKVDSKRVIGLSHITRSVIGREGMEYWYPDSLAKSVRGDRGGHFDLPLRPIRVGWDETFF